MIHVPAAFASVPYRPGSAPDPDAVAALTRRERATLGQPRAAERAAAMLAAKQAVRRMYAELDLREIEVLRRQYSAPRLLIRGDASDLAVSLSHADGLAVAGVLGMSLSHAEGLAVAGVLAGARCAP